MECRHIQLHFQLFKPLKPKRLYLKAPSWKKLFAYFGWVWTKQAIDCFDMKSNCKICPIAEDLKAGCHIASIIPRLLHIFGQPRKDTFYMQAFINYVQQVKKVSPPMLRRRFKPWKKSFRWTAILDHLVTQGVMEKDRRIVCRQRPDGTYYSRWSGYEYTLIGDIQNA